MLSLILMIFAFVFFCLAGFIGWTAPPPTVPASRWYNFMGIGLACWVASELAVKAGPLLGR